MGVAGDESERRAAFAAAREFCRRDGSVELLPSFFLPRHKRDASYACWAFARLIEQALAAESEGGGCCGGGESKVAALLKSRVAATYAGDVELPLPQFRDESQWMLAAMVETVRRFEIPRTMWLGLIDGLATLRGMQRVATWRSLDSHVTATAGNAGRIIAAVLGATHSDAGSFSSAIGRAVGLTSVLHNLRFDLSRGRLLLPLEDLARFRYSEREMLAGTVDDNFRALIRHETSRARELLAEGAAGACWLAGDGSRMAAAALVSLQLAQLDTIEREPEAILRRHDLAATKRPSLASQLRQLPRAWRIARRQPADALPDLR